MVISEGGSMSPEPSRSVSVADAKAHLSELLKAVESGESIAITRRGRPVATLTPVGARPGPVDMTWVRDVTAQMNPSEVSAVDVVREMRDARY